MNDRIRPDAGWLPKTLAAREASISGPSDMVDRHEGLLCHPARRAEAREVAVLAQLARRPDRSGQRVRRGNAPLGPFPIRLTPAPLAVTGAARVVRAGGASVSARRSRPRRPSPCAARPHRRACRGRDPRRRTSPPVPSGSFRLRSHSSPVRFRGRQPEPSPKTGDGRQPHRRPRAAPRRRLHTRPHPTPRRGGTACLASPTIWSSGCRRGLMTRQYLSYGRCFYTTPGGSVPRSVRKGARKITPERCLIGRLFERGCRNAMGRVWPGRSRDRRPRWPSNGPSCPLRK